MQSRARSTSEHRTTPNTMETSTGKTQRMQWRAFFFLAKGEGFDMNGKAFVKGGLFTCKTACGSQRQVIAPWRKVRTCRPVAKMVKEQGEHGSC